MGNITTFLNKIITAKLGKDIRQSIHDAIKQTYDDASANGNANMEVSIARGIHPTLGNRLDTDYKYFYTMLSSMSEGGPKELFYSLNALLNAYPNGATYAVLVYDIQYMDGAHLFIWNSQTWVDVGVYQGIEVPDDSITTSKYYNDSITPIKLFGAKVSKNLFNEASVKIGYYIKGSGGAGATDLGQLVVDPAGVSAAHEEYMPVIGGQNVALQSVNTIQYAFYDEKKKYITGDLGTGNVILAPANARYMRVTVAISNLGKNVCQVEIGNVPTSYEAYGLFNQPYLRLTTENMKSVPIPGENIDDKSINAKSLKGADVSPNMFDKTKAIHGYYVSNLNGVLVANVNYSVMPHLAVNPGEKWTRDYSNQIAFYGKNKNFISGLPWQSDGTTTITIPENVYFVQATVKDINTYQFVKGDTLPEYRPYGAFKLNGLEIEFPDIPAPVKDEFLLFLPSEICIAVGRTIELYNRQVSWTGNINNYHFKWECAVGSALKRKWSCLGSSAKIGSYPLTCTVFNNNMIQVAQATTTVKIVNNVINTPFKLLTIGDSLTNKKPWIPEIDTLSNGQIQFVGTRPYTVESKTYYHEGRSGFSAWSYLNNVAYTYESEGVHPFWNPTASSFDYTYYKTQTGITPDAVQIFLGTNGITLNTSPNADYIKSIVDKIRAADANVKIFVTFTLYRGDQNGIGKQASSDGYSAGSGVWKLEEDRKVFNLITKLNEMMKSYPNLYFIPVALTNDSENNYKSATPVAVNPRSTITELQDKEATHPSELTAGYLQVADIGFSTFCAHMN